MREQIPIKRKEVSKVAKTKYANAYTEVYEILSCLNNEEYLKIPEELIEVFEENRNLEYEYEINDEQDLSKQPMLKESKAILLNLFRDYLATPEQNQKIKQWLQADRVYLENQKQKQYNNNVFENNKKYEKINNEESKTILPVVIKKQSIFYRIINKLKSFFKI